MEDTETDSRHLEVRTRTTAEDHIVVSVTDMGKGIAEEDLKKIYDSFYTTKSGGMGMGLAINKRIIEAHNGRLWAEMNPEGGMTFLFTLPTDKGNKE